MPIQNSLTPCRPDVFQRGSIVAMLAGPRAVTIEAWVQEIARSTEQLVDWHFVGGRAIVRALGDLPRVRAAIKAQFQQLIDAYMMSPESVCPHPSHVQYVLYDEDANEIPS